MDIPRSRRGWLARHGGKLLAALVVVGGLVITTVAIGQLHAEPPTVTRASLWFGTVERGEMLREVQGNGKLVPEHIQWITALSAARVEQIFVRPGTEVAADTVILELRNPELELQALEAERQVAAARAELGLAACLEGQVPRTLMTVFPGGAGPWELRRSQFRQRGLPHTLVVLTDLRRALREEERLAWQRLVRVLGHEINNSLAPIRSIAEHLREQLARPPGERASDLEDDLTGGLEVIARRSASLTRFLAAYARLARLPPPTFATVEVAAWAGRVAALERRVRVIVEPARQIAEAHGGALALTPRSDGRRGCEACVTIGTSAVRPLSQSA
ncbi:hypothetical protein [Nannocystis pusilla]|uniref:hypothetical protein n=1 Tax=Nannocystis pusilla TaxID=889268 RepID=UPI003BF1F9A5